MHFDRLEVKLLEVFDLVYFDQVPHSQIHKTVLTLRYTQVRRRESDKYAQLASQLAQMLETSSYQQSSKRKTYKVDFAISGDGLLNMFDDLLSYFLPKFLN